MAGIDVHQHLLPDLLVDALRRRTSPPFLRGLTLQVADRPPADLDAHDYDLVARVDQARRDGLDLALVSLSSPFGIESLPAAQAAPLLEAYHDAVDELPKPFDAWAGACVAEPDPESLVKELGRGRVGLQLPATAVATPRSWERLGDLLAVLERQNRPLLIHPGPAVPPEESLPAWWLPVVSFVGQMHAAWYAWHEAGRAQHPLLRVCFVGLAGLAPLHSERLAARGGGPVTPDPRTFFETSSYGPRAIGAMRDCVGDEAIVLGSDRPYAVPDPAIGDGSASRAVRLANPRRLLMGS